MKALILGIEMEDTGADKEAFVSKIMEEFDLSGDSNINEIEFIQGISKVLAEENMSGKNKVQKTKKKPSNTLRSTNSKSKVYKKIKTFMLNNLWYLQMKFKTVNHK